MTAFKSHNQRRLFEAVVSELERLGYREDLLRRDYPFTDWFQPGDVGREAPVATFGRTPTTYETACLAVALSNGRVGRDLIADFRALGVTRVFEVHEDRVSVWRIGREIHPEDELLVFPPERLPSVFAENAEAWRAESVLRAKEIGPERRIRQLDFFDLGLIPALEGHIRDKLSDVLTEALSRAARAYGKSLGSMDPLETQKLFRLVFRFLTAKVLHDRGVAGFDTLSGSSDAGVILELAGSYYGRSDEVLDDPAVRETVKRVLWGRLNYQNLSVEVLAYVYEFTLVSHSLRKRLGIHGTPPSIARYIVRNLPIDLIPQDERFVVEPCSGHALFLVAALQRLRELLPSGMNREERHRYFVRMLQGFEIDAFALEVSLLCLLLADFPNPNGWRMFNADTFLSTEFTSALRQARVVLCNPPYEAIPPERRNDYGELRSVHKPEEILNRVLDNLHPAGILGFVLPRRVLDDRGYRGLRRRLAERFDLIEIVDLPESRVFYVSEHKSVLILAKSPSRGGGRVELITTEFEKTDQERFLNRYNIVRNDSYSLSIDEATRSLSLPALRDVWEALRDHRKLKHIAIVHRGAEWKAYVSDEQRYSESEGEHYERGYGRADTERLLQFQPPRSTYLYVGKGDLHGKAYQNNPWDRPKVFVNAARITRKGHWRHAAFLDDEGLLGSQNFHAVWPREASTSIELLSAILNGPVAAAFVKSHEGGKHNTKEALNAIPVPNLSDEDRDAVSRLVRQYLSCFAADPNSAAERDETARRVLLRIDGLLLRGYDLPPHLERKVLDFLEGSPRPVPFSFTGYDLEAFLPVRILGNVDDPQGEWESINERRSQLIDKEENEDLSGGEQDELDRIQRDTARYSNILAPLPFDVLERFEERARRLGLRFEQEEA